MPFFVIELNDQVVVCAGSAKADTGPLRNYVGYSTVRASASGRPNRRRRCRVWVGLRRTGCVRHRQLCGAQQSITLGRTPMPSPRAWSWGS